MKKIISVFLSLILIVSTCSVMTVGAAGKNWNYLQCIDNDDLKCTVLIMTYGEVYTGIGESVQVQLTTEKETITIEQDKILREFHDAGAQLFICLPTYLSDEKEDAVPTSSVLTVSEGVFVDKHGRPSSSYSGTLETSNRKQTTTSWEVIEYIAGAKAKILKSYYNSEQNTENEMRRRVVADTEMLLSSQNWAWQDDEIVFTENDTMLDLSFYPSVCGEHTIIGRVNDFVYDSFSFTVVSKEQAKKENLLILFKGTLTSIFYLPLNVVAVFVMIPGWMLLQAEFEVVTGFFKQLFSKELVEDYVTWVIR